MSLLQKLILGALVALSPIARAADAPTPLPKEIGRFNGWAVYTFADGRRDSCYAVEEPTKPDNTGKPRSKPNLMVTHRPAEKTYNVVSINLGLALPLNGTADVAIGKTQFDFFTRDHSAWSRDADTDKAVVAAMAAGQDLVVKAKLATRSIVDDYSLTGFSQALAALDKACSYRR
jgi:hypothetical protein